MAGLKFLGFLFMATGTVLGRNNRGNREAIMLKSIGIAFVRLMAFVATHPFIGMAAQFPLIDNATGQSLMTVQTGLALGATASITGSGVDGGGHSLVGGWFGTHRVCQTHQDDREYYYYSFHKKSLVEITCSLYEASA